MERSNRDNCKDEANTNEELRHDGEYGVRSAPEGQQSRKHGGRRGSLGGKNEPVAPIPLETNIFRVFSPSEFILRLVEGLLTSVAREFKRGAWVHLDVAAVAEAVSRQVDGWGMQVSEEDVHAAVRDLDLAGGIRVREIDGRLCYRLPKRAWRRRV